MGSTAAWLTAALLVTGGPLVYRTARGALRGHFAADLVAALAIITAVVLGQPVPGLVVVLMLRGGQALERYAEGRASQAVRALEESAPRTAHRLGTNPEDVPVGQIVPGDRLLVRPGEIVPCDGLVIGGQSHLDTASLTGEPLPVLAELGSSVASGSVNQEGALTITATASAAGSQYARIVELVRSAQSSKAPLQRVADQVAVWFTPVTLVLAGLAWAISGDSTRILAVLVVATPCPLILATPVAIIGGVNRGARQGIIMRTGGALEALARVDTVVFDKTGTLTVGRPEVTDVRVADTFDRVAVFRLAGAVESHSGHLLARTLTEAALREVAELPLAQAVVESPGRGVTGIVEAKAVTVGAPSYVRERHPEAESAFARLDTGVGLRAWVAIDGRAAGVVTYADTLRPNLRPTLERLGRLGVRRVMMLSGDSQSNTEAVGLALGIAEAHGDQTPEGKVRAVQALERQGSRVLMVGDGTNDAPALGVATVGLALAAHGGGISAEAADVVLLRDDLALIPAALAIGRRTMRIARQSVYLGLGLSVVAMLAAAAGSIPPTAGAVLQEGIDVVAILNALRSAAATG